MIFEGSYLLYCELAIPFGSERTSKETRDSKKAVS